MKEIIRQFLARRRDSRRAARIAGEAPSEVFSTIYKKNTWGDAESASGKGSNMEQTRVVRRELPKLLAKHKLKSMLDLPCGDYYWMNQTELGDVDYIGADIVPDMIESNQQKYQRDGVSFQTLNLIEDPLPKVDLLFCRDCLVHLSEENVFKALANIKRSGIPYLLTTTLPEAVMNKDILTGQWRRINLELEPYNFPKPIETILEECPIEDHADKSLALWKVADLP